jgi:AP2-associated kinase
MWMLGCILFTLCFAKHPFQDAQKLAIMNGQYNMSHDQDVSEKMQDIIRLLLTPNPTHRPTIAELEGIFNNYYSQ